jgi:hypothetical protein
MLAMERLNGQTAGHRELAKQVLSWIACAKRPLTSLELQHALAVEVHDHKLDKENITDIEVMVSVCNGLVNIDEKSDTFRFVHYTTQEYFERTWNSWFPNAQTDITKTCITYLLFDAFETGFCLTDKEFEARLQSNVLCDYAARNWGYHACRSSTEDVKLLILDLLESQTKVSACSQAMMASRSYSGYSQRVPRQMTGMHLAAYFGLEESVAALLKRQHYPDSKYTDGRTPLSWAAEKGHEAVVKLLLEKGAYPDSEDWYSRTPLHWAAKTGHEAVVKLLLGKGADVNAQGGKYGNALCAASTEGHETIV